MVWYILGMLSLIYYATIRMYSQGQQLTWIWVVLAGLFVLAGIGKQYRKKHGKRHIPLAVRTFCVTSFILIGVLFGVVTGRILTEMFRTAEEPIDYIVILCQSELSGETEEELEARMETALSYLEENTEVKAIVSGGWNANSGTAPAYHMYRYLVEHGVWVNRIIWENHTGRSTENLIHVKTIVGDTESNHIAIVSSNYFSYRALRMAHQVGIWNLQMIPVTTTGWLLPHRIMVEFLNIVYDKLMLH